VKVAVQLLTGQDRPVVSIVGDLVSVHHRRWHLYGALKVEIVAAKVVSELFNLALAHSSGVLNHKVVHWQGSRDRSSLGHHVEVKGAISIRRGMLNKPRINTSARGRVGVVVINLFDKSSVDPLIYEAVEDLGVVVWLNLLNCRCHGRLLVFDHFLLITGTTNTISVNHDLVRQSLIMFHVHLKGLSKEIDKNGCAICADTLLLLVFGH
jgi:hypothetical protein